MNLNNKLKSAILRDFDRRLHTDLATELNSFIANVKLDESDSFHDTVDVIFDREGAAGLGELLDKLIAMMREFHEEDAIKR